jgi:hypothetical protein
MDTCAFECREHCATGQEPDAYGHCQSLDTGIIISFDFTKPAEITNDIDPTICADWCHPHTPVQGGGNRGGWWDGEKSSLLINMF